MLLIYTGIPLVSPYGTYLYKWLMRPVLFDKFVTFSTRLYHSDFKSPPALLPGAASQQLYRSVCSGASRRRRMEGTMLVH